MNNTLPVLLAGVAIGTCITIYNQSASALSYILYVESGTSSTVLRKGATVLAFPYSGSYTVTTSIIELCVMSNIKLYLVVSSLIGTRYSYYPVVAPHPSPDFVNRL